MIHHLFNRLIDKAMLIGTNAIKYGEETHINTTKMTSPDALDIQKTLSTAKSKGCYIAILEVASHALTQHRFHGTQFDMALLTNITPEHLDYHKTMDDYAATKKQLFKMVLHNSKSNKMAVLPKDDKYAKQRFEDLGIEKTLTFWLISGWTLWARDITYFADRTECVVEHMGKSYPMTLNMVWLHNIYNMLAAFAAWVLVGLDLQNMIDTMSDFEPPLGRMERIEHRDRTYFIDFAHTPDALDKTLQYLRNIKWDGRILLLTWAMGTRDRYKRPEMGRIADEYADIIVLADEDPSTESRYNILQDIRAWIRRADWDNLYIIPDRAKAIKFLTEISRPWDLILLAWKWHETLMSTPLGNIERNEKKTLESYLN